MNSPIGRTEKIMWRSEIYWFFRRPTGRSNESLNSSSEMPSYEQRTTVSTYPARSLQTYYGDESDEGLVKIMNFSRNHNVCSMDFVF